jgi:GTP-binding protein YchF
MEIDLLPKLEKDTIKKGEIFKDIENLDLLCHLVRTFKDDAVYHIEGSVEPKRDIDFVNSELIFYDLVFIEKRLERIEKEIKQAHDNLIVQEKELLLKMKAHLEQNLPLRLLSFKPEEKKIIASYPFSSIKQMLIVLNIGEEDLKNKTLAEQLAQIYQPLKIEIIAISAKVESEIALLDSEEEKQEFLQALGISQGALAMFARLSIKTLDLISFFTVRSDEVRQWLVKRGSLAPEAAGAIHSDMQRGFIRAEVIKLDDLISLGSEEKVKEAGKLYIKGKDYLVEDGDILSIRFSV